MRQIGQIGCLILICCCSVRAGEAVLPADQIVEAADIKSGVVIHLGCGDGSLTAALAEQGSFLVQGLAKDASTVERARANLQAEKWYGVRISVDRSEFSALQYANNLANLVVIDNLASALKSGLNLSEIHRVLCPNGVLMAGPEGEQLKSAVAGGGFQDVTSVTVGGHGWIRARKPKPADTGEWNHWRCDAGENPVTRDARVGYPRQLHWVAAPDLTSGHKPATVAVSAGGRLFYTVDETYTFFEGEDLPEGSRMTLVARNAYNGKLLWVKPAPPIELHNLAARGRFLFTIVKRDGPCVALDAETGAVARTYEGTERAAAVKWVDGILLLAIGSGRHCTEILAVDAESGKQLWKQKPGGYLAGDGRVFINTDGALLGLDLKTGRTVFKSEQERFTRCALSAYHDGVLMLMENPGRGPCALHAFSGRDGRQLWTRTAVLGNGYRPVQQLSFVNDLLYVKVSSERSGAGWLLLDPQTGEEKGRMGGGQRGAGGGKCITETASLSYFFKGSATISLEGKVEDHDGFRSACKPGTVPANGMMYYLPADCTCSPFKGTFALVPSSAASRNQPVQHRLEVGPATAAGTRSSSEDWPAFLHDATRGGVASTTVPGDSTLLWSAEAGAGPTAPIIAAGTVFVGTRDHRVLAFDAVSGKRKWAFTTGGPIEAAPTFHKGLCLVGCNDGWVYALNAADGRQVWRLHAAPHDRKLVAFEQIESAWPVNTGVTIFQDAAYFFAGRLQTFDGYHTVAADPLSGKILWEQRAGLTAATGLTADANFLYFCGLGSKGGRYLTRVDPRKKRVETRKESFPAGVLARGPNAEVHGKVRRWSLSGPGRIDAERLVFNDETVFGACWRARRTKSQLFRFADLEKGTTRWTADLPDVRADAMICAGSAIFLAGQHSIPVKRDESLIWKGTKAGMLQAFSTEDGKVLNSWKLPARPVFNALAAARGRLYVSTVDGTILCFGKPE